MPGQALGGDERAAASPRSCALELRRLRPQRSPQRRPSLHLARVALLAARLYMILQRIGVAGTQLADLCYERGSLLSIAPPPRISGLASEVKRTPPECGP